MSNIVVFIGSTRNNGNTERLADAFIEGAEKSGNNITRVHINDYKINGCLACNSCMRNDGKCVQKDDMQKVYEYLYDSDMIVFATPLYYFGFSSQLKAIIDRFYASLNNPFPTKSAVLLATYGEDREDAPDALKFHYDVLLKDLSLENKGVITVGGLLRRTDILETDALDKAEKLGESLVNI